jgi:serine protease Do
MAVGHPKGYKTGRPPVVRLGRVQDNFRTLIRSDCTLVGGDSGGPLFDMNGKVIGIHSRIGPSITYNIHVPVDCYREDWDKFVAGEVFPNNERPYLGVQGDPDGKECKILKVYPDSPAEKAGIKEGDIVLLFICRQEGQGLRGPGEPDVATKDRRHSHRGGAARRRNHQVETDAWETQRLNRVS